MEKMEKVENFLTVRLLMQGKEVGSIIGKKGDNIKQIREQSGARITISDGSTPERIVTINGGVDNSNKAFSMICRKFEEDLKQTCSLNSIPPITLRLIVPASQCGSIIGKGGSKIKEIRELTGASIQVASEMLPGSTERAVTVSGKLDAIVECFKQVSLIILESPPKGDTLSYKPRQVGGGNIGPNGSNTPTSMLGTSLIQAGAGGITGIAGGGSAVNSPGGQGVQAPIIFAHGQAYQVQGQYAIPLPPHEVAKLIHIGALSQAGPLHQTPLLHQTQTPPPQNGQQHQGQHNQNPTAIAAAAAAAALAAQQQQQQHQSTNSSAALSASATVAGATAGSLTQLPPPPPPPAVRQQQQQLNIQQQNPNVQAHEMSIPNDLIGCIIGRGGQKISEIRLVSGANIKIADLEDGNPDRHVSITGTPDQIQLAQFLINTSCNNNNKTNKNNSKKATVKAATTPVIVEQQEEKEKQQQDPEEEIEKQEKPEKPEPSEEDKDKEPQQEKKPTLTPTPTPTITTATTPPTKVKPATATTPTATTTKKNIKQPTAV